MPDEESSVSARVPAQAEPAAPERTMRDLIEAGVLYAQAIVALKRQNTEYQSLVYAKVPPLIELFCEDPQCSKVMTWDVFNSGYVDHKIYVDQPKLVTYRCRHSERSVTYLLALDRSGCVQLVGRIPKATPHVSTTMRSALKDFDIALYEHALVDRSEGRGIGAVTYLRRVIENEMDRLLQLLIAELSESGETEALQTIQKLRGSTQFSEKAKAADAILPPSFFPGAANPFSRLHNLISDGVHNLDDVESCNVFDESLELFELLFEKLLRDAESKRLYAEKLTKFKSRRTDR